MAAAQQPQPLPEEVPGPEVQAAGVALQLPNGSWPCIGPGYFNYGQWIAEGSPRPMGSGEHIQAYNVANVANVASD